MRRLYKWILPALFLATPGAKVMAQIVNPDSLTFESSSPVGTVRIYSGSLWQIGRPQKTFFNMAHHGNNAIITDTSNNYPSNDTSSFILTIAQAYLSTCGTVMSFSHKYDMDTVGDMGLIEASYDGGNSWLMLKDTIGESPFSGPYIFYWEGDIVENTGVGSTHKTLINGKSNGWVTSYFTWQWNIPVKSDTIIVNPDSLMLRFTFISDSIVKNKEGWMIDDFSFEVWTGCSGIEENSLEGTVSLYPNPSTGLVNLGFTKPTEAITVEVINSCGQLILTKEISPQASATLDLSQHSPGLYFIKLQNSSGVEVKKVMIE